MKLVDTGHPYGRWGAKLVCCACGHQLAADEAGLDLEAKWGEGPSIQLDPKLGGAWTVPNEATLCLRCARRVSALVGELKTEDAKRARRAETARARRAARRTAVVA